MLYRQLPPEGCKLTGKEQEGWTLVYERGPLGLINFPRFLKEIQRDKIGTEMDAAVLACVACGLCDPNINTEPIGQTGRNVNLQVKPRGYDEKFVPFI